MSRGTCTSVCSPALPVHDGLNAAPFVEEHDFFDQRPSDSLFYFRRSGWVVPYTSKVLTERQQRLTLLIGDWVFNNNGLQFFFQTSNFQQRLIPAPLQFACDKTVRRVHGIILLPRPLTLIARLRKLKFPLLFQGMTFDSQNLCRLQRRFHPQRTHGLQQLPKQVRSDALAENDRQRLPSSLRQLVLQL